MKIKERRTRKLLLKRFGYKSYYKYYAIGQIRKWNFERFRLIEVVGEVSEIRFRFWLPHIILTNKVDSYIDPHILLNKNFANAY